MALIEILKPDFVFTDDRGTLAQLAHEGYTQVNAVYTKKGAVRGNRHYHKNTREAFYILRGKVTVTASLGAETEKRTFCTGEMFCIRENVRHTFAYEEDTYLVVLYTVPVESADGTKDIVADA